MCSRFSSIPSRSDMIVVYSALQPGTDDFHEMRNWYKRLPQLIEAREIGVVFYSGGTGVLGFKKGLDYLGHGKASAEKLVDQWCSGNAVLWCCLTNSISMSMHSVAVTR
ncbi:uncharacterized protein EI90DRAFT_3047703 [Cantharellus anzutake]|uniref:uncharacterized protein n=1 Tax=Cantharellus anzutake TaxID=1750568 RepID=UPI001905E63F|nr:uncharacterized protein EI90DRAFT_3047703 [Cantharellus anzutake]KAF8335964.1 hypothetical protein EI90DRAFT_3047703 [Cantharellus anzutake]